MPKVNRCDVLLLFTLPGDTGVRVAIELARAGLSVTALCPQLNLISHIPGIRIIHPSRILRMEQAVVRALEQEQPALVLPCDNGSVLALHQIFQTHPGWRERIAQWLGDPRGFSATGNRIELLRTLEHLDDVDLPEWQPVLGPEDLETWRRRVGFDRFVLKQNGTVGGLGVRIVSGRDQARSAFSDLSRPPDPLAQAVRGIADFCFNLYMRAEWNTHGKILAQRYIAGRAANCTVYCHQGKVLALTAVEVLDRKDEVSPSATVRRLRHDGIERTVRAAAAHLQLNGFHGFDFILEEGTDKAWLLELNPRITPTAHLPFGEGSDLIAACTQTLRPELTIQRQQVPQDVVALFPRQLRVAPESPYLQVGFHDIHCGSSEFVSRNLRRIQGIDLYGRMSRLSKLLVCLNAKVRGGTHNRSQRRFLALKRLTPP